jgi:hypothetical protein
MGDAFYWHVFSGQVFFRFDSMKTNWLVTPSQAASALVEFFPDNPVSGANIFATPHHFKDGSSSKPVMLDGDKVSEALLDLTNSQMTKKKPAKRQKIVFLPAEMEGAMTGKEGFESGSENLSMSPNLLG